MVFTGFERELLRSAVDHFSDAERIKTLDSTIDKADGFENWFQVELIRALNEQGFHATVWNKTKHDADVVVSKDGQKKGVELRCWKNSYSGDPVKSVISDHPTADLYLFLAQNSDRTDKMLADFKEKNLETMKKRIDSNWSLILAQRITT